MGAPGDSNDTAATGGWVLGDVVPCTEPAEGWIEDGEDAETYSFAGGHLAMEPGAVAVVEADGVPWVAWTAPDSPVRARPLLGGEARTVNGRAAAGLASGDLDGDRAIDLVLIGGAIEVLWGFGTDVEAHTEWSVDGNRFARDVALADLDGDGLEDLVVGYVAVDAADREGMRVAVLPNLGGRSFGEPVPVSGDASLWGPAFDLSVVDANDDGRPDVYVCNDFGAQIAPNVLLENREGALVPTTPPGLDVAVSCMGTTWGDTRASGELDAVVAVSERLYLLSPDGGGAWYDAAAARGLGTFGTAGMPWGVAAEDTDNDGSIELIVGVSDFLLAPMPVAALAWYVQDAAGRFTDAAAARGIAQEARPRGVVAKDLDGDGAADLVIGDALRSPHVWWSAGCTAGAWIDVEAPVGSMVWVESAGVRRAAPVDAASGWGSTGPARVHVGLGATEVVDRIVLRPPGGATQELEGPIAARRRVAWTP